MSKDTPELSVKLARLINSSLQQANTAKDEVELGEIADKTYKSANTIVEALFKQEMKKLVGEEAPTDGKMADRTYLHIQGGNIVRKQINEAIERWKL